MAGRVGIDKLNENNGPRFGMGIALYMGMSNTREKGKAMKKISMTKIVQIVDMYGYTIKPHNDGGYSVRSTIQHMGIWKTKRAAYVAAYNHLYL